MPGIAAHCGAALDFEAQPGVLAVGRELGLLRARLQIEIGHDGSVLSLAADLDGFVVKMKAVVVVEGRLHALAKIRIEARSLKHGLCPPQAVSLPARRQST